MKILSFGEIIWDIYPNKKCLGGAPLNFAAHASRAGANTFLLSAVGEDELGSEAILMAKNYGVNTEYTSRLSEYPSGRCTVSLSEKGVPSYEIAENVAYDHIVIPKNISKESFDALCFGTLALRGEANRLALGKLLSDMSFGEIFVDLNLRAPFYSKESIVFGLSNATVLKVSDEELPAVIRCVFDKTADVENSLELLAASFNNIKLIILTCGAEGSAAFDTRNNTFTKCNAEKAEVVSTVGAGDSYGATFLVNYLFGQDIETCLKKASKVSAFVVSRAEAIPEEI